MFWFIQTWGLEKTKDLYYLFDYFIQRISFLPVNEAIQESKSTEKYLLQVLKKKERIIFSLIKKRKSDSKKNKIIFEAAESKSPPRFRPRDASLVSLVKIQTSMDNRVKVK